jgi:hypothetical protein
MEKGVVGAVGVFAIQLDFSFRLPAAASTSPPTSYFHFHSNFSLPAAKNTWYTLDSLYSISLLKQAPGSCPSPPR